jgi:hypothetical protein
MDLKLLSEERERILNLHKKRKEVLLFEVTSETPKFNVIDTFDLKSKDGKNFGRGRIMLLNYKDPKTGDEVLQTALDIEGKKETFNVFYKDGKVKTGPLSSGATNFAKMLGFNGDNVHVYNEEIVPLLTRKFSEIIRNKATEIPKLNDIKSPIFNKVNIH